jgi:hypothetical protein
MPDRPYHIQGCRYHGSAQPCGSSACENALRQKVRVLLTDAYVLMGEIGGPTPETWRRKYEELMEFLAP